MFKQTLVSSAMCAAITQAVHTREQFLASGSRSIDLAQLSQSDRTHTCSTAMDRNKNTKDDFLKIKAGSKKFTDANFPIDDALYWKDAGEADGEMAMLEDWITWKRISDDDFEV